MQWEKLSKAEVVPGVVEENLSAAAVEQSRIRNIRAKVGVVVIVQGVIVEQLSAPVV